MNKKIKILYEDQYLIALDKPSGILVIPTIKNELYTLTNLINNEFKKKGLQIKAHPCHRLDKDTSGVIIYAKGKKIQKMIMEQFHNHKVNKKYILLVKGIINKKHGEINFKIEKKDAKTIYNVLKEYNGYSLVEAIPITGRTNQIRIHFKKIGHPLLGESKYAFRKDFDIKFKRVALHSKEIEFYHPITNEKIIIISEIPDDIKKLLYF